MENNLIRPIRINRHLAWPEHHALTPTKFVDMFKRLVLAAKAVQTIALSALPPLKRFIAQ